MSVLVIQYSGMLMFQTRTCALAAYAIVTLNGDSEQRRRQLGGLQQRLRLAFWRQQTSDRRRAHSSSHREACSELFIYRSSRACRRAVIARHLAAATSLDNAGELESQRRAAAIAIALDAAATQPNAFRPYRLVPSTCWSTAFWHIDRRDRDHRRARSTEIAGNCDGGRLDDRPLVAAAARTRAAHSLDVHRAANC